jgi:hypothetical protein
MQFLRLALLLLAAVFGLIAPAHAIEGPAAAGPIGGTDIRSAMLPPPGLYGGTFALAAEAYDFLDGRGDSIPALKTMHLFKGVGAPFLFYVPNEKVLGGSIGIGALVPFGRTCGHLFIGENNECDWTVGDPYVEVDWSRSWAKPRPSKYPGDYPILQGLTVLAGFGTLFPAGNFDSTSLTTQALSLGQNTWDFAPTGGFTYTTPPILAEGTEFSFRTYWNNYLENPETHFHTGDLLDFEFALSEHIGRFQVGFAGFYAYQPEDDQLNGVRIPPDGNRAAVVEIGPVLAYDMPERDMSMKIKTATSIYSINTVELGVRYSRCSRNSERRLRILAKI